MLRWPGNELPASPYFTDVEQHDLTAMDPMQPTTWSA